MLSRVADSIYWMSRYIERAENVARFVDVNLNLMLDFPGSSDQQWQPLVDISGDTDDFTERFGDASQETVIRFLTFDTKNPNSILSCVRAARENARSASSASAAVSKCLRGWKGLAWSLPSSIFSTRSSGVSRMDLSKSLEIRASKPRPNPRFGFSLIPKTIA